VTTLEVKTTAAATGAARIGPLPVLVAIVALCAFALPFLAHAPNRLLSGRPIALSAMSSTSLAAILAPGLALFAAALVPSGRRVPPSLLFVAMFFPASLAYAAGAGATALAAAAGPAARTSLGSGFWLMAVAGALAVGELSWRCGLGTSRRSLVALGAAVPVAALIATGHLGDLSVMKEYANQADVFWRQAGRHAAIVAGALAPALLLGVPLGIFAFRHPRAGGHALAALAIIQTVPSIALFGLLIGPLAALAAALPSLRALGVGGIGLAPAIIALTLYCMLPIVRNTLAGLTQVPPATVDAAKGMGMTARQIFWKVQAPLALPVLISGLRITLVQAIGLTAVAALIGAGGLGAIMFQGLFGNALDLVLLGALPIVAMALVVDALFALAPGRTGGAAS
jgi:osmoprotectant transport system permease protein